LKIYRNNSAKSSLKPTPAQPEGTQKKFQHVTVPGYVELQQVIKEIDLERVWTKRKRRFQALAIAQDITDRHRVHMCMKYTHQDTNVQIWVTDKKTASYKNLIHCSSVWACPVCAAKIRNERFSQLLEIMKGMQRDGYTLAFLTLTTRHKRTLNIKQLKQHLKKMSDSWDKAYKHRRINDLRKKFDIKYIKTLEFKYAYKNGFHPHYHIVIGIKEQDFAMVESITKTIIDQWLKYNPKAKSTCQDAKYIFSHEGAEQIADYVTKMSVCYEMTDKEGAKKDAIHITPSDIPYMILDQNFDVYNYDELIEIFDVFIQYSKGARFMTYTQGLKEMYCGVENETDEEICSNTDDLKDLVLEISPEIWRLIVVNHLRAEMIQIVEKYLNKNAFLNVELARITEGKDFPIMIIDDNKLLRQGHLNEKVNSNK
jgi:hypothetical protein